MPVAAAHASALDRSFRFVVLRSRNSSWPVLGEVDRHVATEMTTLKSRPALAANTVVVTREPDPPELREPVPAALRAAQLDGYADNYTTAQGAVLAATA